MRAVSLALVCALVPSIALARSKAGVSMPDSIELAGKTLLLNGLGVREATVLNVEVYVAGLYVEARSADGAAIAAADAPKKMVLHFVRDVERGDIIEAFEDGFEDVLGDEGVKKMTPRIAQLVAGTRDMKVGQKMGFTYVPGKGFSLDVDGKVTATIPGNDFARALFAIYLGKKPPNSSLKEGLLGKG